MSSGISRSRVSHDRWLVSYADFITLMFAFFVVLYAFTKADQKKPAQMSQAIHSAFKSMSVFQESASTAADSAGGAQSAQQQNAVAAENVVAPDQIRDDLDSLRRELAQTLASQIASHSIALEMGPDGLVISLREAGFFDSGSAQPKPDAIPTLRQIMAKLGTTPYDLRIEGHSDNVPVHNAEFDSNWELSAARATRIARIILEMQAIPPERISAAGYAEYHPVASNDTATGRAENRRVDLVVMPRVRLNFAGSDASQPDGVWRRVTDGK